MKRIMRLVLVLITLLTVVGWAAPATTQSCGDVPISTCATPW